MQQNKTYIKWKTIEAIIINVIIAFVFIGVIVFTINTVFKEQIQTAISLLDMVTISSSDSSTLPEIKFNTEAKTMESYPSYGERYANIKIESLDINLPLYYGDKLSILKNGVGQSSGAYFPGEGGSIICMGHNTKSFLYHLPEIKNDAEIKIETTYGTFTYKVYKTKVVNMYDVDELPIQKDEEILMLYTCYPVTGIGHKTDRFVVYAKRAQ